MDGPFPGGARLRISDREVYRQAAKERRSILEPNGHGLFLFQANGGFRIVAGKDQGALEMELGFRADKPAGGGVEENGPSCGFRLELAADDLERRLAVLGCG